MNNLDFYSNILITLSNDVGNRMAHFARYVNNVSIPVYFQNNGDNLYNLQDGGMIFETPITSDSVPRLVLSFNGLKFPQNLRTLGFNEMPYTIEEDGFEQKMIATANSMGYELNVGSKAILPDFVSALKFSQYMSEAFIMDDKKIDFQSDGMSNSAKYNIDFSSFNVKLNTSLSDNYDSFYPSVEFDITVIGRYANFGYYDLNKGLMGYDGTNNDSFNNFIAGQGHPADVHVKEVITTLTDRESREMNQFKVGGDEEDV